MPTHISRICWNTKNWSFPSGDAPKLEKGTYVREYGFGHEEWLFAFSWVLNGYHYSFLEPVRRSHKRVEGRELAVLLYTIDHQKKRLYVGEIEACHILTETEAEAAMRAYAANRWLSDMKEQIRRVGGRQRAISQSQRALDIFNVRFRPEDVMIYRHLIPADPGDQVMRINRYMLAEANAEVVRQWRRGRAGSRTPGNHGVVTRSATGPVEYDPHHVKLQDAAFKFLAAKYGKRNVIKEQDRVDIQVTKPDGVTLVEIKTAPDARMAIRQAIGQLLEYGYYDRAPSEFPAHLSIVSPAPRTSQTDQYLNLLRQRFGLAVSYHQFDLSSTTLDL